MNIFTGAELIIAALNLVIAGYVLAKHPKSIVHRAFFLFAAGIGLWAGSFACLLLTRDFSFADAVLVSGDIMIAGLFLLCVTFPDQKKLHPSVLALLAPLAVAAAITPTKAFIAGVHFVDGANPQPVNGPFFPLLAAVILAYIIFSAYSFFRRYRDLRGIARVRMRYFMFGAGLFLASMFVFDLLLPGFGFARLNALGPLSSLLFTSLTGYAIVRYRFMDVRVIIRRGILYACAVALIGIAFFGLYFFLQIFIKNDQLDEFVDVCAAAFGAFAFPGFKRAFERTTNPVFFRGGYDYADAVGELSAALRATLDLRTLMNSIHSFLGRTIRPARVIFAFEGEEEAVVVYGVQAYAEMKRLKEGCAMLMKTAPRISAQPIVIQEVADAAESDMHRNFAALGVKLGIAAIIPLYAKGGTHSFLFVGEKLSDDILRPDDIRLLNVIADQAGMAIENGRLYEKIRLSNEDLERRVIEKTEKLRAMYDMQSRFLADISHELQTPVAIMQGNLEIIERGAGRERATAIRVARETLSGMAGLVNNLLEVARLNFSKNKLHKSQLSVARLLQEVSDDCFVLAVNKGITLGIRSERLLIFGERRKLKEVLFNLINNALQHTPAGGHIALAAAQDGVHAAISISDTGTGIPAEDLEKIFDRFYRIKGETSRGSGLGLHICR